MRIISFGVPACVAIAIAVVQPVLGQRSLEQVGDSLYAHFDNIEALNTYEAALEGSSSLSLLFKRAVAANDVAQDLEAEGKREEAEKAFESALEYAEQVRDAHPNEASAWFILAATTGKMAQFKGGRQKVRLGRAVEEYYKKSLALDSTYALAYLVGGIFTREVAQLNWLQKLAARTLFGGIPDASLEESRSLLEKAIELAPTLFLAHWEISQTLEALGETERATEHLRFLRVLSPRNTEERRIRAKAREINISCK